MKTLSERIPSAENSVISVNKQGIYEIKFLTDTLFLLILQLLPAFSMQ